MMGLEKLHIPLVFDFTPSLSFIVDNFIRLIYIEVVVNIILYVIFNYSYIFTYITSLNLSSKELIRCIDFQCKILNIYGIYNIYMIVKERKLYMFVLGIN